MAVDGSGLGFIEDHALILYVYLTEDENDSTAVLTVSRSLVQFLLSPFFSSLS